MFFSSLSRIRYTTSTTKHTHSDVWPLRGSYFPVKLFLYIHPLRRWFAQCGSRFTGLLYRLRTPTERGCFLLVCIFAALQRVHISCGMIVLCIGLARINISRYDPSFRIIIAVYTCLSTYNRQGEGDREVCVCLYLFVCVSKSMWMRYELWMAQKHSGVFRSVTSHMM